MEYRRTGIVNGRSRGGVQLLSILLLSPHSKMADLTTVHRRSVRSPIVVWELLGMLRWCWIASNDGGGVAGAKKETRRLLFCRRVGGLALFGTMLVGDFLGLMAKQSSSPRMRWMGFCSCKESTSALSLHHSAG